MVAFLSFDGFKRRALTTIFVNKEYRRMGIGSALMAKVDKNAFPKRSSRTFDRCLYRWRPLFSAIFI
uniref:GNAT family N-acetyltransferase n=1 Tax=Paenibacillus sp. FSL K6-0276 TaxID=2921450 RepID=UPI00403F712A